MGIGTANGENRTIEATKKAISSPLLEVSIAGAKQVLLNITGGPDLSLFEAQDASEIVAQAASGDVNIIFGTSINEDLGDSVVVTVVATGIDGESAKPQGREARKAETTSAPTNAKSDAADSADPFGNWDLRREPKHNDQPAPSKDFDNVKKTEFDIFESQPTQSQDDGGDDQPPFFKRRRQ